MQIIIKYPRSYAIVIKTKTNSPRDASLLADALDKLPYLEVYDRQYRNGETLIKANTVKHLFSADKLEEDLEKLKHLFIP